MKPYLISPTCGSDDVMKNGMTRRTSIKSTSPKTLPSAPSAPSAVQNSSLPPPLWHNHK